MSTCLLTQVYTEYIHISMNTAVVNVKIDPETKKAARDVAERMGVSLSSLIKSYLREVVKTKKTVLSASPEPSAYFVKMLKKAEEEVKKGDVVSFDNTKDAIAYLDDMIENEKDSNNSRELLLRLKLPSENV